MLFGRSIRSEFESTPGSQFSSAAFEVPSSPCFVQLAEFESAKVREGS